MPRKLSPEHQLELETLCRVVGTIAEFLDGLTPALPDGGFVAAMRKAYDERDLRGLRMAHGDLVAAALEASVLQRRQVDALLREHAGVSLDELSARMLARVARIRARGRITSEEQYYLLRERIEFIADSSEHADEYSALQRLLVAFEEREASRPRRS